MTVETTQQEMLYFNGVNGTTGEYSIAPMPVDQFAKLALKQPLLPEDKEATGFYQTFFQNPSFAPADDRDPKQLNEVGWGVLFAQDEDPAVIEALEPLLDLRREKAGNYYFEYRGNAGKRRGYFAGETKTKFLENRDANAYGPADPRYAPYYLLIVGDPEKIPFKFQYQLDLQYAVGRLHFEKPDDYRQYAMNVVLAETGGIRLPREATFFGVEHDNATTLSANFLVKPLLAELEALQQEFALGWQLNPILKDQATKATLASLVNGKTPPALLFTASHGLNFDLTDPRLERHQGALLCPDLSNGTPDFRQESNYFSADDISSTANVLGRMAFHFACFSAGSPRQNNFLIAKDVELAAQIAHRDFLAQLPRRFLLAGALAVVGHVERAWGYSIVSRRIGKDEVQEAPDHRHLATYRSTLRRLMDGHPVGSALEFFNEKYGEYSAALSDSIEKREGKLLDAPDDFEMIRLWTANNDARNYVIVGDPAARLPVANPGELPTSTQPASYLASGATVNPPAAQPATGTATTTVTAPPLASPEPSPDDTGAHAATSQALQAVLDQLTTALKTTSEQLSTLEVLTYTSTEDLAAVYDVKTRLVNSSATLKVVTCITVDGQVATVVPVIKNTTADATTGQETVALDERLWTIHREMVELAPVKRGELIKTLVHLADSISHLAAGQ